MSDVPEFVDGPSVAGRGGGRRRVAAAAGVAVAVGLSIFSPAYAGGPGVWTPLVANQSSDLDSPSITESSDGLLHSISVRNESDGTQSLIDTVTNDFGAVQSTLVIADHWGQITQEANHHAVTAGPNGLQVVFTGGHSSDVNDPLNGSQIYISQLAPGAAAWGPIMGATNFPSGSAGSYGVAVADLPDGTPVSAGVLNDTFTWNVGTVTPGAPASGTDTPNQTFTIPSGYLVDPSLVQVGGVVYASYKVTLTTPDVNGTYVREIYPTLGAAMRAPMSNGDSLVDPTDLVARANGDMFVAYCEEESGRNTGCGAVDLWHVGTANRWRVPGSVGTASHRLRLSVTESGRMWVSWADSSGLWAVPTSTSGLRFGVVRQLMAPQGSSFSVGAVNVYADDHWADEYVTSSDNDASTFFHQVVLPGIQLSTVKVVALKDGRHTFTYRVADAGAPIPGTRVMARGLKCSVPAGKYVCSITYPSYDHGRFVVKATAPRYVPATIHNTLR